MINVFVEKIIKWDMVIYRVAGGEKGRGELWQIFCGWDTPKAHQELIDRLERFVKANNLTVAGDNYTE